MGHGVGWGVECHSKSCSYCNAVCFTSVMVIGVANDAESREGSATTFGIDHVGLLFNNLFSITIIAMQFEGISVL